MLAWIVGSPTFAFRCLDFLIQNLKISRVKNFAFKIQPRPVGGNCNLRAFQLQYHPRNIVFN